MPFAPLQMQTCRQNTTVNSTITLAKSYMLTVMHAMHQA